MSSEDRDKVDNSSNSLVNAGIGSSHAAGTIGNIRSEMTVLQAQQITHNIIKLATDTKDDKGSAQQQQQDEPDGLTVEQRNRLMLKAGAKGFLLAVTDRLSK